MNLLALLLLAACSREPPAPTGNDAAGRAPLPPGDEGGAGAPAPPPEGPWPIRVGWQTTWATQGQLAVLLVERDILERWGFAPELVGFSYGGPLNEGALAGEVDVLFTADQPAIALAARDPGWGVIGRLMYNRVGTFVPPDSPVASFAALAGRTLAVPFGAAAHRAALGALREAGLAPGPDVQVVNLGVEEIVALVGAGARDGRWGTVDAAAAWDPPLADLEHRGAVRTLGSARVLSVVVMGDDYRAAHPGADERFMKALRDAYDCFRRDPDAANRAFARESGLPFDVAVLERAAAVEPNLSVAGPHEIGVHLSPDDLTGLQRAADFMVEAGLLREQVAVDGMLRPTATSPLDGVAACSR